MTIPSKAEQKRPKLHILFEGMARVYDHAEADAIFESLEAELAVTRRALELMVQGVIEEVNDTRSTPKLVQRAVILAMEAARKERGQ